MDCLRIAFFQILAHYLYGVLWLSSAIFNNNQTHWTQSVKYWVKATKSRMIKKAK